MKSFSKRVASFTMAAAMVLSLAAVSPVDAEAATAKITKKSSITAGKTYTYNVKNVTKSQYIKVRMSSGVTVKYNNKTVKKNSTKINGGKTIALKVKAADKVANYKATVKAVIYNKKTNKKVKTLTTQSTVKVTKLKVTDVKRASTSGKYLVATFNKPLSKLSIADVTITEKNTGILKGVEKVELSSDGKSATIALVGSEDSAGVTNTFVLPNTDYVFSVTQSGVTASTTFSVDAVLENLVVTATDAVKKTIFVDNRDGNTDTFTVPDSLGLDYQDILGRKITVWFNEDNSITKMNVANDKVILDSFECNVDRQGDPYLKAKTSGDVYYIQRTTQSGNIQETANIYYGAPSSFPANNVLDYAKVVLNSNGTIKSVAYVDTWSGSILIDEVKDNTAIAGKKFGVNLTDYVLVKDGKQIKISDIQAGDVLYYYNGSYGKFAEVYNNSKSGTVVEAVTSDKITVDGTKYAYKITNPAFTTHYVKADDGIKDTDEDYMNALKKGAKGVTLYFDRQGRLNFIKGEPAEVKTSTKDFVLTDDVKTLTVGLDKFIRLAGENGDASISGDINFANVNTLVFGGFSGTELTQAGKTVYKLAGYPEKDAKTNTVYVKEWAVDGDWNSNGTKNANIKINKVEESFKGGEKSPTDGAYKILKSSYELDTANFGTEVKQRVVTLTYNDKDQVTGIEFCAPADTVQLKPGLKTISVDSQVNQISGTVPVYEVYTKEGKLAVKKVNYSDFTKTTQIGKADVYVDGKGNVTKIVVDNNDGLAYGVFDHVTVTSVVKDVNSSYGKMTDFTIVSGKEEVKFAAFANDTARTPVAVGEIVTVDYDKETKEVQSVTKVLSPNSGTVSTNTIVNNKITLTSSGGSREYELSTSVPVSIVKLDVVSNEVTVLDYTDLTALKEGSMVTVHVLAGDYVDVIVVKSDAF